MSVNTNVTVPDGCATVSIDANYPAVTSNRQPPAASMVQAAAMILCAACGTENPEGARFCNGCGARLVGLSAVREQRKMVVCSRCGRENPDGFVYCGFRAASLTGQAPDRRKLARVPVL
jgi:hypothetical protein